MIATLQNAQSGQVRIDGTDTIMLGSNNYLGLASHPEVVDSAVRALNEFGIGTAVNPPFLTTPVHAALEEAIVELTGLEDALLFTSCSAANMGVLDTLAGEGDIIFSDRLNHASIIDGCRLSRARTLVYESKDPSSLETLIGENQSARRRIIVTDGVFSMEGDVAPLRDLIEIAERHDALVVVDECHAAGVIGKSGRGSAELFDIESTRLIMTGTFSKAFGAAAGGYVAGNSAIIAELQARCRAYIFTAGMSPSSAAASTAAIKLHLRSASQHEKLWQNTKRFRDGIGQLGFHAGFSVSPITSIHIGDAEQAKRVSKALLEAGVFIPAMTFPIVPMDAARLRAQPTAALSSHDVDVALERLNRVGRSEGLI